MPCYLVTNRDSGKVHAFEPDAEGRKKAHDLEHSLADHGVRTQLCYSMKHSTKDYPETESVPAEADGGVLAQPEVKETTAAKHAKPRYSRVCRNRVHC